MGVRIRLLVAFLVMITMAMVVERYYWSLPVWILELEPDCLNRPYEGMVDVCSVAQNLVPVYRVTGWTIAVLGMLILFLPLAYWVLLPVRALLPVVSQLGPQNLGHRVRPRRRRRDEVSRLGRALDEMMDRIAAGYEGQRRFAANASHELRTPLALQRTLIEVGMAEPLTPEQSALLAAQLLAANSRNERLIEGLLVLSQADQGLAGRTPQRLDEIARSVTSAHAGQATGASVALDADLRERIVQGDGILLERLVRNLVHNAITYNEPGGHVTVRVADRPALEVSNSGPVIAPGEVSRLFEPFTRLATDRIDHSGGSGLGLAIARAIVQAHDGTISAEALDGGGLRVSVKLP